MKLKGKDAIKIERERLLKLQKGIDPITGLKITDPVLDHNHLEGFVRSVLQREVNAFEGKVLNAYNRYIKHLGISIEDVLINLQGYWQQDYSGNAVHPKYFTPEEKERKRLLKTYKRRLKEVKRPETQQKYRDLIKELKEKSDQN